MSPEVRARGDERRLLGQRLRCGRLGNAVPGGAFGLAGADVGSRTAILLKLPRLADSGTPKVAKEMGWAVAAGTVPGTVPPGGRSVTYGPVWRLVGGLIRAVFRDASRRVNCGFVRRVACRVTSGWSRSTTRRVVRAVTAGLIRMGTGKAVPDVNVRFRPAAALSSPPAPKLSPGQAILPAKTVGVLKS